MAFVRAPTLVSQCYLEEKVGGLRAFLRLADAATPRAAKGIGNAKTKLDFADVRIYKDEFINPRMARSTIKFYFCTPCSK